MSKVYKLTFKDTNEVHFFRSVRSIYRMFSVRDIGANANSVWNAFYKNGKYENKTLLIERTETVVAVKDGEQVLEVPII